MILLYINNLCILHCSDPLVPKWWPIWCNEIDKWRNLILLFETILVPSQWVSILLIKNLKMSCIDPSSLAHCFYMDGILQVHPCACVKSSLHLISNVIWVVWHLCKRRMTKHTILFICWTWRLTITHHIRRVNISLIRWVTKLSPYTHRLKTSWK